MLLYTIIMNNVIYFLTPHYNRLLLLQTLNCAMAPRVSAIKRVGCGCISFHSKEVINSRGIKDLLNQELQILSGFCSRGNNYCIRQISLVQFST